MHGSIFISICYEIKPFLLDSKRHLRAAPGLARRTLALAHVVFREKHESADFQQNMSAWCGTAVCLRVVLFVSCPRSGGGSIWPQALVCES